MPIRRKVRISLAAVRAIKLPGKSLRTSTNELTFLKKMLQIVPRKKNISQRLANVREINFLQPNRERFKNYMPLWSLTATCLAIGPCWMRTRKRSGCRRRMVSRDRLDQLTLFVALVALVPNWVNR